MKHTLLLIVFLFICSAGWARRAVADSTSRADTLAVADSLRLKGAAYRDSLLTLISDLRRRDSLTGPYDVEPSPFYFPLLSVGTLYQRPLTGVMGLGESGSDDEGLRRVEATAGVLSRMYAQSPWLFPQTEQRMSEAGKLRDDIDVPAHHEVRLSEGALPLDLDGDIEPVAVVTRRPNFWKFWGNGSLQFQQSYFSDNWYQSGDNNYSALTQLTLNLKFDNRRKLQWENCLELQLGFQTTKGDTCHTFRPTSNLIRYTTKLGYQAAKYWYYSGQVQLQTQMVKNYNTNSRKATTDIFSPMNVTISMGLDYKVSKKRISWSLFLAPLAYSIKYVQREALATRYGVDKGHHSKHTFGPNITARYNWKICDNITWDGRIYWFSNYSYTDVQWENTFTFSINKYLNTKLFVYPKFDDSAARYKGKHDFFMLKEWLSIGVNYSI